MGRNFPEKTKKGYVRMIVELIRIIGVLIMDITFVVLGIITIITCERQAKPVIGVLLLSYVVNTIVLSQILVQSLA